MTEGLPSASLGVSPLSSGIAHELNNVLTVLRTYTHFARQPTTREQCAKDLRVVAAAAERASALVDWLSSNSEETPRAIDELSANTFVSTLSARLEQLVQPATSIDVMRVSSDMWFRANALRLEHVMMSLVLAASQRWSETAFAFSVEQRSSTQAQPLSLVDGLYVVLVITCSDATKESDWQAKLLVTPDVLGALVAPLADLMRAMHGKLELIRTGDGNDRFELYLPAITSPSLAPRPVLVPPSSSTVCVIENDPAIRHAIARTLSSAGYQVIEANDGVGARELLIQHGQAVRLLICDVGELRASEAFFSWVQATCPNASLLLVSGNASQGEATASSLRSRFLPKPFTSAELLSVARETIARADADLRGTPSAERPSVLIVDDEEVIRNSLERLLVECEFDTATASSGLHALRMLDERRVDAIVTDQFMPGLGGIDLLELVSDRFPGCVRILCTGHPSSDVVLAAIEQGRVHRVLSKSMHAVALRDEIEAAILEGIRKT